ncbi:MAG: alpha/beta hydrolase [Aureliella sp.]
MTTAAFGDADSSPPIYLLPGMTRDYPVFSRLAPLLPGAKVVSYLEPMSDESIAAYARRMAQTLQPNSYIAGVSFGGIIAQEISRVLAPRGCIAIATITHPTQLPPWFRAMRILGGSNCKRALSIIGTLAARTPKRFRNSSVMRLSRLAGPKGAWHRWAAASVLDWAPSDTEFSTPLLHIHGDADTTFPIRYTTPDVSVRGGLHALPISHPSETATAILDFVTIAGDRSSKN